jgi:hypothetical protein
MMTDEKRKHGRIPLVMEASWEGSGSRSLSRTTDISATGCFIDAQGSVEVGDILNINLIPADGQRISVQGGVGFGVRFTKISDSDRLRLDAILKADLQEPRRNG